MIHNSEKGSRYYNMQMEDLLSAKVFKWSVNVFDDTLLESSDE